MFRDLNQEYEIRPPNGEKAREWATALSAAGLDHHVRHVRGSVFIMVHSDDRVAATEEIAAYEADNFDWPPAGLEQEEALQGEHSTWAHVWCATALLAIYAWLGPFDPAAPALVAGAADADAILHGEWWRTITALTLHSGPVHLLGNMLSLFLLGGLVCRAFGGGVGILLLLATGVLGNTATAFVTGPGHLSVGASTGCFGALGSLAAHRAVAHRIRFGGGFRIRLRNRTWIPIAAGLALLGMVGSGPQSDLVAHLFGFLAGILLTLPLCRLDTHRLPDWTQMGLQMVCLLLVLLAWKAAFYTAM